MLYALILIVLVIYNNAPALKGFRETHSFKKLMGKMKLHKDSPDKHKEDEAKWDRVPTKIEMNEVLSVDMKPTSVTLEPDRRGKNK